MSRMGGISRRGRDWSGLNNGYRNEYQAFLRLAKDVVWGTDASRLIIRRSRRGAPVEHDIRALVALLLFKLYLGRSYRWMESYLKSEPSLLRLLELKNPPSYETIRRSMYRVDSGYLHELNERVRRSYGEKTVPSR